jgi:hypothetical protein
VRHFAFDRPDGLVQLRSFVDRRPRQTRYGLMHLAMALLVVVVVLGGCPAESKNDEQPGGARGGDCAADEECPSGYCQIHRAATSGVCREIDDEDGGSPDELEPDAPVATCDVDADCSDGARCSSHGQCYKTGSAGGSP